MAAVPSLSQSAGSWAEVAVTLVAVSRSMVLKRYRTVLRVLTRHGFGFLLTQLGLSRRASPPTEGAVAPSRRGERLRRALEELGPTFVKLGQVLSTRSDVLPPDITAALERLQDQVQPFPFEQVVTILETELGAPVERRFATVSPVPLAAASLGQVHEATLRDGTPVVIKVQRPDVGAQIELDLHVLRGLANLAARRTQWGKLYDLPGASREFAAILLGELDYRREGENADRFRTNFADDPWIQFPHVFWEYSTGRVLTLERMHGLRVTDRAAMIHAGIAPSSVAERLAGAIFKMVMRDGFFHADPHPGNLFVSHSGAIIFVDMGMVGQLSPAMRENVVEYVLGVVTSDSDRVVHAITQMGVVRKPGSRMQLRHEIERLQRKYGDVPIKQVEFGPALRETLAIARRFDISFPSGYTVLLKTMSTLEAVARHIDPDATLVGLAAPYATLLMEGRLSPERLIGQLGRELLRAGRSSIRIPGQVSRVLGLMEEGEWKLSIDHTGLDPALQRLSAIANRLALSILLASLIIGTALVSSGDDHSFLHQYPIADIGFVLIGAFGLWLVLSILRSRRP